MFTHLNTEFVAGMETKSERASKRTHIGWYCLSFLMPQEMNINNCVCTAQHSTALQLLIQYIVVSLLSASNIQEKRNMEKLVEFRLETADNTVRCLVNVAHSEKGNTQRSMHDNRAPFTFVIVSRTIEHKWIFIVSARIYWLCIFIYSTEKPQIERSRIDSTWT